MRRMILVLACVAILGIPVANASAGLLFHHDPLKKMTKEPLLKGHKPPPGESYTGKQPKGHHAGGCCGQQ